MKRKILQVLNGQSFQIDTSPKKIYNWPIINMKRFSASLFIREMQMKTTTRYHFTPTKKIIIKNQKKDSYKYGQGCGKIGTRKSLVGM